jgi:hypothetical protein
MTVAPPPAPTRNRLGITALVLVLIAIIVPIVAGVVGIVAAATEGAQTPDSGGWAVLGGLVFAAIGFAILSPIAIIGVVLAIVSLTRHGRGKVPGVVAIVLGIIPSLTVFGLPAALDSLF